MYIDGDTEILPDYSYVEISLVHCKEYTDADIECASERET